MKGIFVIGTDTGVGKSIITGLLVRYLKKQGYRVITQKWVETGSKGLSSDVRLHLKIAGIKLPEIKKYLLRLSPHVFKLPASPHLAAKEENKGISISKIKNSFKRLVKDFDFVVVEGTGGALVPISKNKLLIDIAKELRLPVLIVARNKLGSINHTLMTIEAVRLRKMKISGIIFNNAQVEKKVILNDNPDIVRKISHQKVLGVLPWDKDYNSLYIKFIPIARNLII